MRSSKFFHTIGQIITLLSSDERNVVVVNLLRDPKWARKGVELLRRQLAAGEVKDQRVLGLVRQLY